MVVLLGRAKEIVCRGCGCSDSHACIGGCSWVLLDIDTPTGVCSACAIEVGWDPRAFIMMGREAEDAA